MKRARGVAASQDRGAMAGHWGRALLFAMHGLMACGSESAPRAPGQAPPAQCKGQKDGILCEGERALTCEGERVVDAAECDGQGLICSPQKGCVVCHPDSLSCDGNRLLLCDDDGDAQTVVETCGEGLSCSLTGCRDLCADAIANRSYIGCEYWPVFTANSQLSPLFKPAVAVGNANRVPADIVIRQGDAAPVRAQVAPNAVEVIELSYGPLKQTEASQRVASGAYHLLSSVPVTVHQFNPLLFETEAKDGQCEEQALPQPVSRCYSYSNDASLLLPAHVFERPAGDPLTYMALSRPSFVLQSPDGEAAALPGFVTLVATGAQPVQVSIKSAAHVQSGVADLAPGDVLDVTMTQGEVLQLLSSRDLDCGMGTTIDVQNGLVTCPPPPGYDLTGTEIKADGPLQVIAGHDCTNVPIEQGACDHLEESMFPVDTWSTNLVVPRPRVRVGQPYLLRVLSSADDNRIEFDPPVVAPITLGRGEFEELSVDEHLFVRAQKPIAVAQFLRGQGTQNGVGDPSMALAIPVAQYRSQYEFLTPATYTVNYVSVMARAGDSIKLDGQSISGFTPVGDSGYEVTAVATYGGQHRIESSRGYAFGIMLYGVGAYTSYMLPGGLDLRIISAPL